MKIRILMLSLLGLIFFNSCSSDSNSSNSTSQNLDPNTILPKKIIRENAFDESISYDFFYNQSKLDHIHSNYFDNGGNFEFDFNFTYNGNLITKIEVVNNTGQIYFKTDFTYNNNKLVNKQETHYDFINGSINGFYDYTYTYNSSNNIITRTKTITDINGDTFTLTNTFTITNNLVFRDNDNIWYSTSSSPFKNIIGIQDAFIEGGTEYDAYDYFNIFFSTTKNIIDLEGGRYVYIYNDIEFPTTALSYPGSTITPVNYQIFYQ